MSIDPTDVPVPLARRMAELLAQTAPRARDDGHAANGGTHASADTPALSTGADPDTLAAAGLAALRRALSAISTEEAASDLLAADALITHACASAASDGVPGALAPEHFVALLEEQ
ncbi:MAG TPA: hypothetical protein VFU06_14100 [Longimicrobiales bacterium]|nr:hypothetical protein [Longimicrobiales bacterium]